MKLPYNAVDLKSTEAVCTDGGMYSYKGYCGYSFVNYCRPVVYYCRPVTYCYTPAVTTPTVTEPEPEPVVETPAVTTPTVTTPTTTTTTTTSYYNTSPQYFVGYGAAYTPEVAAALGSSTYSCPYCSAYRSSIC